MVDELGLETDGSGNVQLNADLMTSHPGIFSSGDMVMGASLVVRAIIPGTPGREKYRPVSDGIYGTAMISRMLALFRQ